jgi:hypothetical protein
VKMSRMRGVVRRRILLNYRVDPEVMQRQLPSVFRPQLVNGWAVAGICLIRLEQLRPRGIPAVLGLSSENAAHRVAVRWMDATGHARRDVYIPRRETGSAINAAVGRRVFPVEARSARFVVNDDERVLELSMLTQDGAADVRVRARHADALPTSSCFGSLEAASEFFASGTIGYSAANDTPRLDGVELRPETWRMHALDIDELFSSYYTDPLRFPPGSIAFDSALVMRDIVHEWHVLPPLDSRGGHSSPAPAIVEAGLPSTGG